MSASQDEIRAELKARHAASANLLDFGTYVMPSFEPAAHHKIICEHLEAVERADIDRLIILCPPRHSKSQLASRFLPAWWLGRRPTEQVLAASYGSELASDFGRDVRNILSSDLYANIFSTQLSPESRAADRWSTTAGGRYVAAGVGGPITGRGAHLGIIDDPIKSRAEADSTTVRENLWQWYRAVFYTRLMPGGRIVLIQTAWHEDDLGGRLQNESDDWTVLRLPAINDQGEALWPEWFDIETLNRIKSTVGPREFQALYQGQPQPESGTYFERDWFRRYTDKPEYLNYYISHDLALSEGQGDYSEIAVVGIDPDDNLWLADWWSGRKTLDKTIDQIIKFAKQYKPKAVIGEGGPIRRAAEPFIAKRCQESGVYFLQEWVTRSGDKPAMARAFQARCSMQKVYIPSVDWGDEVVDQLLRFPAGKYDDKVDALANLGLALDHTHKAVIPKPFRRKRALSWMTR